MNNQYFLAIATCLFHNILNNYCGEQKTLNLFQSNEHLFEFCMFFLLTGKEFLVVHNINKTFLKINSEMIFF
jgi:hypothetical protein